MPNTKEKPKISEKTRKINEAIESLPPPPISVLPDILIRQPTPAEKEKQKLAVRHTDC